MRLPPILHPTTSMPASDSLYETIVFPPQSHIDSPTKYSYLSQSSPNSSPSSLPSPSTRPSSPATVISTSCTLVDPENPLPNRRKSPSSIHRLISEVFSFKVLCYSALFALIGTLAGTLNFVTGCFALGPCTTHWIHGTKYYTGTEWLGLGPLGGLFVTAPAALAFYVVFRQYYFLKERVGRPIAMTILLFLMPVTYIGISIFGGFIGWELLHHTLKGNYDSSMTRALLIALVGSGVFCVPLSLILALMEATRG